MERIKLARVGRGMDRLGRFTVSRRGPNRPRRGRVARVLLAAMVALAVLGAVGVDVRAQQPALVDIQDSNYIPTTLTVPVGTTVRWINHDEEVHTVTSTTGQFASAGLDLKEEYTYTFTNPGVYPYTCDLHPHMRGTIVVN
jgi:plastocyanin